MTYPDFDESVDFIEQMVRQVIQTEVEVGDHTTKDLLQATLQRLGGWYERLAQES